MSLQSNPTYNLEYCAVWEQDPLLTLLERLGHGVVTLETGVECAGVS